MRLFNTAFIPARPPTAAVADVPPLRKVVSSKDSSVLYGMKVVQSCQRKLYREALRESNSNGALTWSTLAIRVMCLFDANVERIC